MRVSYTQEQRDRAVCTYHRLKSYEKTIRVLGYPSRHVLFDWVRNPGPKPKPQAHEGSARRYSWPLKKQAVERLVAGERPRDIAQDMGITNGATIYAWARKWRLEGDEGLMSRREKIEEGVFRTRAQLEGALPDDVGELKRLAARLIAEKAVLEKELELAKKAPCRQPLKLPARKRAAIVSDLRGRLPLRLLLEVAGLPASSYYYALAAARRPDKHAETRLLVREISEESGHTYGSPRIWLALRRRGVTVSEKVVRRLMREERIEVRYARRRRRYSSYMGEITPAPKNLVGRDFHANAPNRLWLTDISEFAAKDAKVYLSPMIDCFDGKVVSWATSCHPDEDLVEAMLEDAIGTLSQAELSGAGGKGAASPLCIHTDRGGHYRGGRWIERLEGLGITRSMSAKGNSGDNAACEGFFGRMKTEMYYGRRWESARELEDAICDYMDFYNNRRIKASLGGLTIAEHRDALAEMSKKVS